MAELEQRLRGASSGIPLHPQLAAEIPDAATYLLVLIDGLGAHQLGHPAARPLARDQRAVIDAPFPTTTTVGLATVATAAPPSRHGLIGHFLLFADHPRPVNALRWVDSAGRAVDSYAHRLLPAPNLWERLLAADIEPITVQPADYERSALTRTLYRGCRFEGVTTTDEWARASLELAQVPGRLIFSYYPAVDVAAHMRGTRSRAYGKAMADVANAWERMAERIPRNVTMIGTADHGVVPVPASGKTLLKSSGTRGLTLYGDPRTLYVRGPQPLIERLGARLPARWRPRSTLRKLWGPAPAADDPTALTSILEPDGAFLADRGRALIPGHMDKRMVGYHGGLDPGEIEIPLLVASRSAVRSPTRERRANR